MRTKLLATMRSAAKAGGRYVTLGDLVEQYRSNPEKIGRWVWDHCTSGSDRSDTVDLCGDWPGWPECQCAGCGCSEHATTTNDGGVEVCAACADYTLDENGSVVCSHDERTEIVTESCGAGNQTRTYLRMRPPEMPESDAEGEWCLYWETCGSDAHVVTRFTTRGEAEQALAAKDWPRPGDNTNYMCGYSIRHIKYGEWVVPSLEY